MFVSPSLSYGQVSLDSNSSANAYETVSAAPGETFKGDVAFDEEAEHIYMLTETKVSTVLRVVSEEGGGGAWGHGERHTQRERERERERERGIERNREGGSYRGAKRMRGRRKF